MKRVDARAAVLAAAILGALVALAAIVWSHPKVLLYVLLALIGVLAYAALYLIVSSKIAQDEPSPAPPSTGEEGRLRGRDSDAQMPADRTGERGNETDSR